jgi:hypothetical protein
MTGGNRRKGILNLYVALDTGLDDVDIANPILVQLLRHIVAGSRYLQY